MGVQSQTVFTQQRNGTKQVFSLGHEKLAFTHSDASGENSREIAWEQIDLENSSTVRVKGYLVKRPDKVLLYIGAFLLLMARVYYSRRRGTGYTIFKTAQNPSRIIQDKQHDLILAELRKRRGQRLKEMFGVRMIAGKLEPGFTSGLTAAQKVCPSAMKSSARFLTRRGGLGTLSWPGAYGGWWQADPEEGSVQIFLAHNMLDLAQMATGVGLGVLRPGAAAAIR